MKDRQFTIILVLVVAAGLVMGLVAFRMSGAGPLSGGAASAVGGAPSNAPRPSAADQEVAGQPAGVPPSTDTGESQNSEPAPATAEPQEMQGSVDGDPPGTAAELPSRPGAPQAAPGDVASDTLQ